MLAPLILTKNDFPLLNGINRTSPDLFHDFQLTQRTINARKFIAFDRGDGKFYILKNVEGESQILIDRSEILSIFHKYL